MSFDESGDPAKCSVMIKIEKGINTHYSTGYLYEVAQEKK
jgi:hypothetical protein